MASPKLANIKDFPELKFARKKDENYTYVLQYPPQIRSIFMSDGEKSFRLAFSYLTFIINLKNRKYDKTVVGTMNKPLESVKDKIYRLPLSNIYRLPKGMGLCMTMDKNEFDVNASIQDRLRSVINLFWFTRFGGTVSFTRSESPVLDTRVSDYFKWQANTKQNPDFATTVNWPDPDFTIEEMMDLIIDVGYHGSSYQTNPDDYYQDLAKRYGQYRDTVKPLFHSAMPYEELGLVDLFEKPLSPNME